MVSLGIYWVSLVYTDIYREVSDFWYVQVYYNLTWGNLFIGMFISN